MNSKDNFYGRVPKLEALLRECLAFSDLWVPVADIGAGWESAHNEKLRDLRDRIRAALEGE